MQCPHRDRMWPVAVLVQVTAADTAVGHAHAKLAVSQRRLDDILQPQITRPMPPQRSHSGDVEVGNRFAAFPWMSRHDFGVRVCIKDVSGPMTPHFRWQQARTLSSVGRVAVLDPTSVDAAGLAVGANQPEGFQNSLINPDQKSAKLPKNRLTLRSVRLR